MPARHRPSGHGGSVTSRRKWPPPQGPTENGRAPGPTDPDAGRRRRRTPRGRPAPWRPSTGPARALPGPPCPSRPASTGLQPQQVAGMRLAVGHNGLLAPPADLPDAPIELVQPPAEPGGALRHQDPGGFGEWPALPGPVQLLKGLLQSHPCRKVRLQDRGRGGRCPAMQLGEQVDDQAALGWRERLAETAGSAVHEREDTEGVPGPQTTDRFAVSGWQGRHDEAQLPLVSQGPSGVHGPAQATEGGFGPISAVTLVRQVGDGDEPLPFAAIDGGPVIVAEAHRGVRQRDGVDSPRIQGTPQPGLVEALWAILHAGEATAARPSHEVQSLDLRTKLLRRLVRWNPDSVARVQGSATVSRLGQG